MSLLAGCGFNLFYQIRIMNVDATDEAHYTCEARTQGMDGAEGETLFLIPQPRTQQFCSESQRYTSTLQFIFQCL